MSGNAAETNFSGGYSWEVGESKMKLRNLIKVLIIIILLLLLTMLVSQIKDITLILK